MTTTPKTGITATPPETESERYASEQTAPTDEETREAGEFKYG